MTTRLEPGTTFAAADSTVAVEVLVCGSPDRGDDGAALAVAALVGQHAGDDIAVRVVGSLDIGHLLAVPPDAGVVIVDAAVGTGAGNIVVLPLTGVIGRGGGPRPRSSHALPFPEVIALAELMRGRPLRGRIVVIGGVAFGLGDPYSRSVAAALPALATAVIDAIAEVGSSALAPATSGNPTA
jgi:hydrogenase maturation protease